MLTEQEIEAVDFYAKYGRSEFYSATLRSMVQRLGVKAPASSRPSGMVSTPVEPLPKKSWLQYLKSLGAGVCNG